MNFLSTCPCSVTRPSLFIDKPLSANWLTCKHLWYLPGLHFSRPCWRVMIWPGVSLFRWQSVIMASSSLRGPSPQVLTLFGEVGFIASCLRCPFLGECWRTQGIFGTAGHVCGLKSCARTHQKKALCYTCMLGGTYDKYQLACWYASLESWCVSEALKAISYI